MSLALLEQELDDIHVQLERLRPADTAHRGSAWGGLSDAQGALLAERDELRDRRVAIKQGDRLTLPYCA